MLDGSSISVILDVYRPERAALVELLRGLRDEDWARATECPRYSVKGIATHVLGDDLSLLSRQRDAAVNGIALLADELAGSDFPMMLDTFNDRWVASAAFLSPPLLLELLRLSGEWTAAYYEAIDPDAPGEPVFFFGGAPGQPSPFWQAIAREYLERFVHHSQIRRALGLSSLDDRSFLAPGVEVAAAVAGLEPGVPVDADGPWTVGPIVLGPAPQAAAILSRGHTPEEVQRLATGPADLLGLFAAVAGRS